MKQNFLKWMVCMCFGLLSVATVMAGGNYKTVKVKAPFPMQPLLLLTHVIKRAVDVWLFRQAFG